MKQIKPGGGMLANAVTRDPSSRSPFGVLWTIIAAAIGIGAFASVGGPFAIVGFVFPLFGILVHRARREAGAFHKHNATAKEPHSIVDITDTKEDADPFAKYDQAEAERRCEGRIVRDRHAFCTSCGAAVEPGDRFCPKCGNRPALIDLPR
ncbi:MAG: zinc-ribbon domain-containing protein [Candidatus Moduliflexus flocculans]|nr:zinc-ribbon domain-containing protein [Candidatus Moduliflexus flocculans]